MSHSNSASSTLPIAKKITKTAKSAKSSAAPKPTKPANAAKQDNPKGQLVISEFSPEEEASLDLAYAAIDAWRALEVYSELGYIAEQRAIEAIREAVRAGDRQADHAQPGLNYGRYLYVVLTDDKLNLDVSPHRSNPNPRDGFSFIHAIDMGGLSISME
jgi:hypothetical protein